jgi:two-component system chemotaxis family response regulator WspR
MEERKIDHAASFISRYLTISLGVGAILAGQDSSPEELVRAADQALYRAKREGRNRVAVYGGE